MGKAFENELGVQAPLGYWDPAGFSKDGDAEDFYKYREAEIKHGRVAMFATIGYITPEYFKLPGYLSTSIPLKFADVPNGLAAFGKVPTEGWLQIIALCGYYELVVNQPGHPTEPGNYYKGRLGVGHNSWDPTLNEKVNPMDDAARTKSLNSEIANGRLAMFAIIGMMAQNGFVGTTGPAMWLPGGATARQTPDGCRQRNSSLCR